MVDAPGWDFADSWLFAAIALRRRRCTLVEVVSAADMVNHAIPTGAEIETALGRLTGAGLVRVYDDWTFEATDEGEALWPGGRGDLTAQLEEVAAQLAELEPGRTVVRLPRGARDAAVATYLDADPA